MRWIFDKDISLSGARKRNCTWQQPTLSEPLQDFTQRWNMEIFTSQPFLRHCRILQGIRFYCQFNATVIHRGKVAARWWNGPHVSQKGKKKISGKVKTLEWMLPVTELHCEGLVSPAWGEKNNNSQTKKREGNTRKATHSYPVPEGPRCHCPCHWEYARAVWWPVTAGKTHPKNGKIEHSRNDGES